MQDVAAHRLGVAGGIGVPQQGEQRPAEAGSVGQLGEQEFSQLRLVHLQHVEQRAHLAGQPLLDAGGDHLPLVHGEEGVKTLPQLWGVGQAVEEGGKVRVVAQPLGRVSGVLPLRPVVRPAHPVQVGRVLDAGVVGGNGHISVYIAAIMARYRVGHTKQVWHWRHSISKFK